MTFLERATMALSSAYHFFKEDPTANALEALYSAGQAYLVAWGKHEDYDIDEGEVFLVCANARLDVIRRSK